MTGSLAVLTYLKCLHNVVISPDIEKAEKDWNFEIGLEFEAGIQK
jgi:hypothetical protein